MREAGVSDAPEYERRWIGRLWELLDPRPPLVLFDYDVLIAATISGLNLVRSVYRDLDLAPAPHRAAMDAARLAASWRAGGGHASPVLSGMVATMPEGSAT